MRFETIKKRADFIRIQKSEVKWIRPSFIALATPRCYPQHEVLEIQIKNKVLITDFLDSRPAVEDNNKKIQVEPLQNRIGYVVTKKIDKRAVVRNRIKRRLRALVNDTKVAKLSVPLDILLIARAPALVQDFVELQADWQRAMLFFRSKFKPVQAVE